MRRGSGLSLLNLVLYGVIAVLVLAFHAELRWGASAVTAYVRGEFPQLEESRLRAEGYRLLTSGGDPTTARRLFQRSLAIEPYTVAGALLGEALLLEGREDDALVAFERYTRIDPSDPGPYLRIAEILRRRGRDDEAVKALRRGIDHLTHEIELLQPRPDPTVDARFNDKARAVHSSRIESLRALQAALGSSARRLPGVPSGHPRGGHG